MKALFSLLIFSVSIFIKSAQANIVGSDAQNFNPITSGLDYATVHSSKTLESGVLNIGLFYNYSTNTLIGITDQVQKDSLSALDLNFGLGLSSNWDIGLSFPRVLQQKIDEGTFLAQFDKAGSTEARINTKIRLAKGKYLGLATVFSVNFPLIENNPFTGTDPGPIYNAELVIDTRFKRFNVSLNGGIRSRNPGKAIQGSPISPLQNQIIGSMGISYFFVSSNLKLIAEGYAAYPIEKAEKQSDREVSAFEVLFGFKKTMNNHFDLNFGGTSEVFHGTSTPQWRVYAGLNAAIGPLYGKDDDNNKVMSKYDKEVQYVVLDKDEEPDDLPVKKRAAERKPSEVIIIRDVVFQTGSSQLDPELSPYVDQLADHIQKTKNLENVIIEGHTDSVGGREYNMELSQKRALAVKMKVQQRLGLDAKNNKLVAIGYGMERPIASNESYQGRLRNRRVEIKIFKGNDKKQNVQTYEHAPEPINGDLDDELRSPSSVRQRSSTRKAQKSINKKAPRKRKYY